MTTILENLKRKLRHWLSLALPMLDIYRTYGIIVLSSKFGTIVTKSFRKNMSLRNFDMDLSNFR